MQLFACLNIRQLYILREEIVMSNESNKSISCHHHDYFEAACVKKAKVKLVLKDGSRKEGVAWDIVIRDQAEHLVLHVLQELNRSSSNIIEIALNSIKSMTFIDGAKFGVKTICLE